MALTDISARALKPREKAYKVSDSGGLQLLVSPNGSKLWRLAYRFDGKQKTLAGGAFPAVGIAEARRWRDTNKELIARGEDPSEVRKRMKRREQIAACHTFEITARNWHEKRKTKWSERYTRITMNRLEGDVFPIIGSMPISKIEPADILATIQKIESRGAIDMAHRINNVIGEIFKFAVALGTAKRDPSRDITAALKSRPPVEHRKQMRASELPIFFSKLQRAPHEPLTKLALQFTMYTLVRTNETRFAMWKEFENLGGREPIWRIPAERMKMRSEFLVPLPPQAVALLQQAAESGNSTHYAFPGMRDGPLSENTMLYMLHDLGWKGRATVHGFRGLGSTILNESGRFQSDWIEAALAHQDRDGVRAAYNSALWLKQRRKMLEWYADYLDARAAEGRLL